MSIQLVVFVGSMGVMEGRDATHIREKYRDMFMPALVSNWSVWPMVQVCSTTSYNFVRN